MIPHYDNLLIPTQPLFKEKYVELDHLISCDFLLVLSLKDDLFRLLSRCFHSVNICCNAFTPCEKSFFKNASKQQPQPARIVSLCRVTFVLIIEKRISPLTCGTKPPYIILSHFNVFQHLDEALASANPRRIR